MKHSSFHRPDVDYFPITACPEVIYSPCTADDFYKLRFLNNEMPPDPFIAAFHGMEHPRNTYVPVLSPVSLFSPLFLELNMAKKRKKKDPEKLLSRINWIYVWKRRYCVKLWHRRLLPEISNHETSPSQQLHTVFYHVYVEHNTWCTNPSERPVTIEMLTCRCCTERRPIRLENSTAPITAPHTGTCLKADVFCLES